MERVLLNIATDEPAFQVYIDRKLNVLFFHYKSSTIYVLMMKLAVRNPGRSPALEPSRS